MDIQEHAEAIATRSGRGYGFDPVSLLIAIAPILLNQCVKAEESNMSRVKQYVETHTATDKKRERTEVRLARRIRWEGEEASGEDVTKEEALGLASDFLDHFLELPVEEVTALCRSIEET